MNNLNPEWKLLYIPIVELCDNDPQMSLLITAFDYDSNSHHDMIGSVQLTLSEMQTMAETGYKVRLVGGVGGMLGVTECMMVRSQRDGERRGSISAYPPRRGTACTFNQNDPNHQEFLQRQVQAQELLSEGQEQCPRYQENHQPCPDAGSDSDYNQLPQWNGMEYLDLSCPYPAHLVLPQCSVDRRPDYTGH